MWDKGAFLLRSGVCVKLNVYLHNAEYRWMDRSKKPHSNTQICDVT